MWHSAGCGLHSLQPLLAGTLQALGHWTDRQTDALGDCGSGLQVAGFMN